MEIKFSSVVAFIFIASFVIPEDHGAVVLKKFKPKRALLMESKSRVNSNISSAISKHQVKDKVGDEVLISQKMSIVRNSTDIDNKVDINSTDIKVKDKVREEALISGKMSIVRNSTDIKVKDNVKIDINSTDIKVKDNVKEEALISGKLSIVRNSTDINNEISRDAMLNSTVVNQILNSSYNLSKNLSVENSTCNKSNSECSKFENLRVSDQTSSTTESSLFSDISEMKEKLSKGLELNSDFSTDPKVPVFDVELMNNDGSLQENDTIPTDDTLKNETLVNTDLKTDTRSVSQQNVPGDLSKLADRNFGTAVISNESTSNGVNNLIKESLQVVTEVLPIQDGVEKAVPTAINLGHSDSENILNNTTLDNQTEMGLESIITAGLDFLAQSEIAKNAAVAMEIFNLSDSSLTDHMVDDPDSMINLVLPAQPSQDAEPSQNNIASETALNEMDFKNEHNLTIIHSNVNNNNSTIELSTEIASDLLISGKKKCPAPGICIFWFIARNSCTNDDQCLGSKICCKVRCSKQCIDV